MKCNIGLIGLGVMGENLAMNMESKGFSVAAYARTSEHVTSFMEGRAKGHNFVGCYSLEELVNSVESPRRIMLMIKAGSPVDQVISNLAPLLDKGDVIIDGGNSNFNDSIRRYNELTEKGICFIGMGVSGGEEGALNGPSLMPGGSKEGWEKVKDIYLAISAKTDKGEPCCAYMGTTGAGHYVKMVHNGIEYGDMQIICEVYDLMRKSLGLSCAEMGDIFTEWNKGELDSYLIEITRDILKYLDTDGTPIVEKILDSAGQKGTGKWASISALDEGIPLTLINEAVYARCLSALKPERIKAENSYGVKDHKVDVNKDEFVQDLKNALYAAKIISYAQGFALLKQAAKAYDWELNYGDIALTWRGGCIIRSRFLGKIKDAFDLNPQLDNLLLDPYFKEVIQGAEKSLRKVVATAVMNGVPVPSLSSALAYFDGYTSSKLPQNLLQAQRDYFGAHTYKRVDDPSGEAHHTNWTGHGGTTTANVYNA